MSRIDLSACVLPELGVLVYSMMERHTLISRVQMGFRARYEALSTFGKF
jgi:hypothetical protein